MFSKFLSKSYHRQLLERHIKLYSSKVTGQVLDVGSGSRRYDKLFKADNITAIDIQADPEKNILQGDMHSLDFADESFNNVIFFEVLCYSHNFQQALKEMLRVLKNDGNLLLSIPFLVRDSKDRIRFTRMYFEEIIRQTGIQEYHIDTFGNSATLIWDILRTVITSRKKRIVRILFSCLLLPYYLFIKLFLNDKKTNSAYYTGLFICIKK
ncbi:MAG: class I SAM-dependent methyltransferase [bacterium]